MSQVIITINYREYPISCEDGGEIQIMKLGRMLDEKARSLTQALGPVNENLLLAMTGLLVADELSEAKKDATMIDQKVAERTSEIAATIEQKNAELEQIKQQINRLEADKAMAERKADTFEETLKTAEQKIIALETEKNEKNQKISEAENTTLEALQQITDLEASVNTYKQQITQLEADKAVSEK